MSSFSLLQAINSLWLPKPDAIRKLRLAAENATDAQAAELLKLVKSIEKKQNDFLAKMVTADPQFPQKLAGFLRASIENVRGDVEAKDAASLSSIAAELDKS